MRKRYWVVWKKGGRMFARQFLTEAKAEERFRSLMVKGSDGALYGVSPHPCWADHDKIRGILFKDTFGDCCDLISAKMSDFEHIERLS